MQVLLPRTTLTAAQSVYISILFSSSNFDSVFIASSIISGVTILSLLTMILFYITPLIGKLIMTCSFNSALTICLLLSTSLTISVSWFYMILPIVYQLSKACPSATFLRHTWMHSVSLVFLHTSMSVCPSRPSHMLKRVAASSSAEHLPMTAAIENRFIFWKASSSFCSTWLKQAAYVSGLTCIRKRRLIC